MGPYLRSPTSLLLCVLVLGCSDDDPARDAGQDAGTGDGGAPVLPVRGAIVLSTAPDGTADVMDDEGTVYLRRAHAEVLLEAPGGPVTVSTAQDCPGSWSALRSPPVASPFFASARGAVFECTSGEVTLRWELWTVRDQGSVLARVTVGNATDRELRALRLTPLISAGPDGGLFLGTDVARHRILDNGADVARDTIASLHYPGERRNALHAALPIESRGNVVANWNVGVADLDDGRHLAAGALVGERCLPTIGLTYRPSGPIDATTRRPGFDLFAADCALLFQGKPFAPGEQIPSEPIHFDPLSPDPWTALERYADAVAAWQGTQSWTRRGRPVPNGWNSWTGSGSTGGLGTNIDETIMQENLAVMAREFEPYGVDYFQIDDGYQAADGDWEASPTRFPSGMEALAADIEATGLIPGIWIQAMVVDESSRLAAEHGDWLADPADAALGGVLAPDPGKRVLDLSNADARAWLTDTMRRYRTDWHMGWLKLDFAYLAFGYHARADPRMTAIEAYRQGLLAIREGLGPDVFLVGIGLVGMGYGIVDAQRLTLDDGPRWEDPAPFDLFGQGGSYKSTVRTGARRYYLHGRVWLSHNDLLFSRTSPEEDRELTPGEHRVFASFIGLTGSLVKFGEDLRTLTPDVIGQWRRLLPTYPATARPVDLFLRHYPEVYVLPIDGTTAGSDAIWTVVGLLNWGTNFDYDNDLSAAPMPEESRTYRVELARHGLDPAADYLAQEFWSGRYLGPVRGTLERTIAARSCEVIALRRDTGHPQLLGHNRHFTQGATDLVSESWDEASTTLTVTLEVNAGAVDAVPFPHEVYVHAPAGFTVRPVMGTDVTQDGEVVTERFTPDTPGARTLVYAFDRAAP